MSVRIPQDSERSGLVRIEGDPKGVQLARRELIEMVQRMVSTATKFTSVLWTTKKKTPSDSRCRFCRQENERTKDLIVEQKFHRTIIGQKGEKIKEVRDKFPEVTFLLILSALLFSSSALSQGLLSILQVIINFPDPAQKSDIVQLRGPKNEVEKCAKFLQKIIADLV